MTLIDVLVIVLSDKMLIADFEFYAGFDGFELWQIRVPSASL